MRVSLMLSMAVVSVAYADDERVVAIGDLHADLDNAIELLHLAGVTDAEGHWAAGDMTFVQTGDLTDRGADSRDLIALMARLETEAAAAGGRVVALIGNHEAMNVHGDWRYVTRGDVERYGGMDARRLAYSPLGFDGGWIREHDAIAMVGDTVFLHAGLHPSFAALGVDALNAAVRAGLDGEPGDVHGSDGPLWYRGYALDDEAAVCPLLDEALRHIGARRMVVGHSVQRDGNLHTRCDGKVVLIDVGVADGYGAHYGALELRIGDDGSFDAWAITPTGRTDLADP